MSDRNYTTKRVELPLSTNKEYVLVDVYAYRSRSAGNVNVANALNLEVPFKLDVASRDADGWQGYVNGRFVIGEGMDCDLFREVIRDTPVTPQEDDEFKAKSGGFEWKNGDACVYDGREYVFVGMTPTLDDVSCILFSSENGVERVSVNELRKPETEAERIEREQIGLACKIVGYDELCGKRNLNIDCSAAMRAVIDCMIKSGYRK